MPKASGRAPRKQSIDSRATSVASVALRAATAARNEDSLRHAIEVELERACRSLGIPWVPYQLERPLRGDKPSIGFADVVHGAVVIEYEPPRSFTGKEGSAVAHARQQAEDYTQRLAKEEGRDLSSYVLVAWDGAHITFGSLGSTGFQWDRLEPTSQPATRRLLHLLREQGQPIVHPQLLHVLVGPESDVGALLLPELYRAVVHSEVSEGRSGHTKTTLLFKEWKRLFGQAVGIQTERLDEYLNRQSENHGVNYRQNIPAFLFSLHTYIAITAKLVAALALPRARQNVADITVAIKSRIRVLESGQLFADAGITNMLTGDFFSWYADDESWPRLSGGLERLLNTLREVSFDMQRKRPDTVRDLFKGLYEVFVPRELRHALGEVYTPDWLAAHALDRLDWDPSNDLLDPTCGTGTFVLEAVKRRLVSAMAQSQKPTPSVVLRGIYGMDLNPLAVLAAKASIVVVLGADLNPTDPVTLPVFLADAINSAEPTNDGNFVHVLQTERGPKQFIVPGRLVRHERFFELFGRLRTLISSGLAEHDVYVGVEHMFSQEKLSSDEISALRHTIGVLVDLHREGWDGIWCSVLADRFAAAGAIAPVSHIAGNPPWVKWSHLPPEYANFIKPLCLAMNVFSEDRYVGGIESDISTVITFASIRKWLAPDGKLGFFITATVFANESSQGFRRFAYDDGTPMAALELIEDFKNINAFQGVTNHPTLFIVRKGSETQYPIPYRTWRRLDSRGDREWSDAAAFRSAATYTELWAEPVPGSDAGPLIKGTASQLRMWNKLLDASSPSAYTARKGITTDLNGVYFVEVEPADSTHVWISNDPDLGRKKGVPQVRKLVERTHLFPLLRGRDLAAFRVQPARKLHVLV